MIADPGQLRQVLVNLVDNAIKYSPEGGPVALSVANGDRSIRFAVADQGLGIPPPSTGGSSRSSTGSIPT